MRHTISCLGSARSKFDGNVASAIVDMTDSERPLDSANYLSLGELAAARPVR